MRLLLAVFTVAAALSAQIQLPERVRAAGVLRWASDAEGGAPFVFPDPADPTREIGFEVDIAEAMANVFGLPLQRVQYQWDKLSLGLERGDFDFAMNGVEPTAARLAQVRFTRPYYIFQQQLTVAKDSPIRSLEDCIGKRVGVLSTSASHVMLEARPEITCVVYEGQAPPFAEVANGRNAAALADLPIAVAMKPMHGDKLRFAGEPFGEYYYAIAVARDDAELQRALDAAVVQLLADGTLERIYRKWEMWSPVEERLREPRMAALLEGRLEDLAGGSPIAKADFAWGPSLWLLLRSSLLTVGISFVAFALAVVLGLVVALVRLHGPHPLRWCAVAYVELFRGTPVLVQLLFLYYGLGQLPALQLQAWQAGVIGLGLNYAAYEAEIYRGAIAAVPRGQTEAAWALGFSRAQSLRLVLLPQALRLSLAPSTNDFIALFKDSAIVQVITVIELSKQYQMLSTTPGGSFIVLGLVTSGFYLAMSLPLAWCARRFERRLDKDRA